MSNEIRVFGLGSSKDYAEQVCESMKSKNKIFLSEHLEDYHDDGEPYILSKENVRGCDVFIISSLYASKNESIQDKLIKSLFFARSLRDASAKRITMIFPYLAYQRQDRKTESRAPVYTKYIPEMIEGLLRPDDRILTIDAHNLSAYQSGFRLMLDHLEAKPVFTNWFSGLASYPWKSEKTFTELDFNNLVFVSPDDGGLERVGFYIKHIQSALSNQIGTACIYKTHEGKNIKAHGIMGDVKNKDVFIIDDMISSGKTLVQATKTVLEAGGKVRGVCATHGLFVGNANENISWLHEQGVKVIITDTIHTNNLSQENKNSLIVLSTANLVGEAMLCIHNEESVSRLLT